MHLGQDHSITFSGFHIVIIPYASCEAVTGLTLGSKTNAVKVHKHAGPVVAAYIQDIQSISNRFTLCAAGRLNGIDNRGQSKPAPAGLHRHLVTISLRKFNGQSLRLFAAAAQLGQPGGQIQHTVGGITGIADKVNITNAAGETVLRLSTFAAFLLAGVCVAVIVLLINSTYGRAFKAIRDDEVAAEAMGINLSKHKRLAFVISSFFAGVGGGMFAMFANQAQAKTFTTAMTYEILLIVVIGGIGSVSGSCIAAFLYVAASEWWLRFLDAETFIGRFKVPLLRNGFRMVVFSVVIMIVVLFFRRGIMGDKELPDLLKKRRKEGAK